MKIFPDTRKLVEGGTSQELDSDYGHFAGGLDHQRWAGVLTRFLAQS